MWFYGRVADTDVGRSKIEMKVKSLLNLLAQQQMCRGGFIRRRAPMFSVTRCAPSAAPAWRRPATAAAGSNQAVIVAGLSPSPATLYDQGTIVGVTGANAGLTRTVAQVSGGTVYLLKAWLYPVAIGDTFEVLPGCDHTAATCQTTFNNLIHFGGFPYIPPPELAV